MDSRAIQHEIDAILQTLDKAKQYAGLGPGDPSVIALERIMLDKVAELEALKTEDAQALHASQPDPAVPSLLAGIEEASDPHSVAAATSSRVNAIETTQVDKEL